MNLSDIDWQMPWLLSIAFIPLFLFILSRIGLSNLKRFAESHLLPWLLLSRQANNINAEARKIRSVYYMRIGLQFLLWFMLALAAAGPRQADQESKNKLVESVDIMVLLDISRSMKATDLIPDRLSRARVELLRLLDKIRGDRIGIIVYGGRSLLVTPPTRDKSVIKYYLDRLNNIDIPVDGSNLLSALKLASATLQYDSLVKPNSRAKRPRAILVVSDGGISDNSQSLVLQEISTLLSLGIKLYSIGAGTLAGGTIPDTKQHWLRYKGTLVRTKLDEQWLRKLARTGEGRYARMRDDDSTVRIIYRQGISHQASYRIDAEQQKYVLWNELYFIPLIMAVIILVILLVSSCIPFTRKNNKMINAQYKKLHNTKVGTRASNIVKNSLVLLTLTLVACSSATLETSNLAKRAYLKHQYRDALALYNSLDIPQLSSANRFMARIAAGNSAYRLSRWSDSISWYQRAFVGSHTQKQKAQALFNMANAWTQLKNYAVAIRTYEDTLLYLPKWNIVITNLALVRGIDKIAKNDPGYDFAVTSRLGKGPRSRRAIPGLNLNKGSTSIDNSPKEKDESGKGYEHDIGNSDSSSTKKSGEKLVLHNKLIQRANGRRSALEKIDHISFYEVRKKVSASSKDSRILWRRLFFYENKLFIPDGERVTFPRNKPW